MATEKERLAAQLEQLKRQVAEASRELLRGKGSRGQHDRDGGETNNEKARWNHNTERRSGGHEMDFETEAEEAADENEGGEEGADVEEDFAEEAHDDVGWHDAFDQIRTPKLDSLRKDSLALDQYYVYR